ncbi:MAG: carboxy terminal-processing peptidase [Thermoguttaceae bacterium]|jgi:carboxyl-terminal processing protease
MTYPILSLRRRWSAGMVSILGLVVLGASVAAVADPVGPAGGDRQVTLAVTSLLKREHLSRHPLDKVISERCLKTFLQSLDPMKVYFYQSDIDAFSQHKDELCDMAQRGDVSFAYQVFRVLLARIDERIKLVDELLAMPHDFTKDEEMAVDKDVITYAKDPGEARERWRKRIKYDLLVLKAEKSDGKPDKSDGKSPIERLTQRYHSFAKRTHQTDSDELLEMYLTAMTTALDPHTDYMSPGTLENFEIMMRLELEGIGASLQGVDGYTVVKKIIPGGAADKDGRLKLDDKILAVGEGETGEMVDVVDMKLNDVVKMIRGKPGTTVRLEVVAMGSPERKIIKIGRAKIELKDSEARGKVFEFGRRGDGKPYKVGVIDLPSFYMDMSGARRGLADFRSTTRDVRKILDDFNAQGVDAVVLDLRKNGGGSLTEAINLTGLFIKDGPVVQVKDAEGRVTPYNDLDPSISWSGPLVVLISKFSASASEILAGAIQDYGRGLIVGDHATHGKGTVQSLLDLGQQLFRMPNAPKMGALKITMQQFYRPDGDSTQKRGVLADVELPSLTTHLDVGEADLDYSLPFDKVEPASFTRFGYVAPDVVAQLRQLSAKRCAAAEKFQKVLRNIARYKEQKAKKYVTLNEAKFLKERSELNADKEEEKTIEKLESAATNEIERDYYLDEAMAITADYMGLRQVAKAN